MALSMKHHFFPAKQGAPCSGALGAYRDVSERTFVWCKGVRRLHLRFECTAFMHEAAYSLAMCVICFRHCDKL